MKDVSITLVNESCFSFLKELESNSIDLALIDPPYEVSRETNFKSGEAKGKDTDRFRVSMDFGDWDSDFTGLDEVIKELYRVLRKGGTLICFYDIWKISILRRYFDDAKFRQIRFIEWVKTYAIGALYNLATYIRPEWVDNEETNLTIDVFIDGTKCQSRNGVVAMNPESYTFDI